MILILKGGNDIANKYGFNSAIETLCEGFDELKIQYTFDETKEFDVIIANDYFNGYRGIELKKKTGKPLIASLHLSHPDQEEEKELIKNCDGIITYSHSHFLFIVDQYKPSVPIQIVALGINTNKWKFLNEQRSNFLFFVGRTQAKNKNFMTTLMKSFTEGVPLKVAGDLEKSNTAGIDCKYMDKAELLQTYNKAQLHILPSLFEPFGLVTLEAMCCGCPVAVSIKSGVSELLNDDVAILFDPFKPFSLKSFMETSKKFDSNVIRNFALKFNHVNHAQSFIGALEAIKHINSINKISGNISIKQKEDLDIIAQEIKRGDYDYFDKNGLSPVKDKSVVDIGAYMGETAVYFSKKGAKIVYAIEPFETFNLIKENAKDNKCDNIIGIRGALGNKNKICKLKKIENDGSTRFLNDESQEGNDVDVEVMTLKTITDRFNIEHGFLKIDCEGAEINLLYIEDENTLKKYDYIIIETHEDIHSGIGLILTNLLKTKGFNVVFQERTKSVGMIYANK